MLAFYHFATLYHRGQGSKEYAIHGRLAKLGYRPARSEEYVECLNRPENEEARECFVRLAEKAEGWEGRIGMSDCCCCGMPTGHDYGEHAVALCDDCKEAECTGLVGCEVPPEPEDEDEDEESEVTA